MESSIRGIFCFLLLFGFTTSYSQAPHLNSIKKLIEEANYDQAILIGETQDTLGLSTYEKAELQYTLALAYKRINREDKEIAYLVKAKENYELLDSIAMVDEITLDIIHVLAGNSKDVEKIKSYINEYLSIARRRNNPKLLTNSYMALGGVLYDMNNQESLYYFKLALQECQKTNDLFLKGRIYQSLGAIYATKEIMKTDSSLYYYNKAEPIYKKFDKKSKLVTLYLNRGIVYYKEHDLERAILECVKADSCELDDYKAVIKASIYEDFAKYYRELGDYKNALLAYEKEQSYLDSLHIEEQEKAIKEIEAKYKTKEKIHRNEQLQAKNKLKTYQLFVFSGVMVLAVVALILVLLSYNKKRKLAEQQRTIEIQKRTNLLRVQELQEIEVMIKSQEEERQRIANELHHSIDSKLTLLKSNFTALVNEQHTHTDTNVIFERTGVLLQDMFDQVEAISGLQQLGIGNAGLVATIQQLAQNISIPGQLMFQVSTTGTIKALNGKTELLLFRVVQELCTNIIKHAKATEVTISLAVVDDQLYLKVTDNGIGMHTKKRSQPTGMGLENIKAKIAKLGGSVKIVSERNTGTTVGIKVPV